jgi:hypothetical protein
MWVFLMLLVALSVALYLSIPASRPSEISDVPDAVGAVLFTALVLGFSTAGTLIATRQPQNRIGWILIAAGFALGAEIVLSGYVDYSLAQPQGRLPGTLFTTFQ